ncbi:alpha/beta fold hydrolase [Sutcliffiella rhizosphaerae]|uniref:2-succinyl-6-hydroxy-2, 4-cyclohexadiene-1-carboxylate synthase n=1 Tax=Sutcliffiella rhizosphaerae TaxID=2880967 RepID=A0ABM8YT65_9BACI|nr:alpha/beta hydrolase [Sutcliffiella rhizosphaerae]CAG9623121.1 2-succinyl-6-hydroxy-2, 4-cyclohexadiene-1-carboxylate synthase [Sutcliffiella rhizosphaerae]
MNIKLNNGETLSYLKRQGGGHVVLLIHGNMASSVQYDLLLEKMDSIFTIYAVDLRGYGNSTYHKSINSMRDFSEDLKQFVDQLDLKKVYLIGWSNGGGVAMQFATDYPEHVNKMVLLSSMSTRGYPAFTADGERIHLRDQLVTAPKYHIFSVHQIFLKRRAIV